MTEPASSAMTVKITFIFLTFSFYNYVTDLVNSQNRSEVTTGR